MSYESFIPTLGPRVCDEYANAMTYALWKLNLQDIKTTSQIFCRDLINNGEIDSNGHPVKIPYIINAGLGPLGEWLSGWKFTDERLRKMAQKTTQSGARKYEDPFLNWLGQQRFRCDIDAMPEGELILPHEPALRITGPFWQQEMIEGFALAAMSSNSNITTIATQFRLAAHAATRTADLFEFGLRRSPSIGDIQSARGTWIAGWNGTSNCYAADCYGIPEVGTHAHAFVMLFEDEMQAFAAWAKEMPNAGVFLVDTYNSVAGIKNAIKTCKGLGIKLQGIRLDSGDMTSLGREARKLLDAAGFDTAIIMGTDSLAVKNIRSLMQGSENEVAPFDAFGVGTNIAGALQNPVHSEVMKLSAEWENDEIKRTLMKFSESAEKSTLPGVLDVLRFMKTKFGQEFYAGDTIVRAGQDFGPGLLSHDIWSLDPKKEGHEKRVPAGTQFYRPIAPWMRAGAMMQTPYIKEDAPQIALDARALCQKTLDHLDLEHKRLTMPHLYVAGVEEGLQQEKILRVRDNRRKFAPEP